MAKKIHFSDEYQPRFGVPHRAPLTPEELAGLSEERLREYMHSRQLIETESAKNPVGWGWTLPSWEQVFDQWKNYNVHIVLGGNQCVRADTMVYDPVLGIERRIDSIKGDHYVHAWDGNKIVVAMAEQPFLKGTDKLFRVTLKSGNSFVSTKKHRVMSEHGWMTVGELRTGSKLISGAHSATSLNPHVATTAQAHEIGDGISLSVAGCSEALKRNNVVDVNQLIAWYSGANSTLPTIPDSRLVPSDPPGRSPVFAHTTSPVRMIGARGLISGKPHEATFIRTESRHAASVWMHHENGRTALAGKLMLNGLSGRSFLSDVNCGSRLGQANARAYFPELFGIGSGECAFAYWAGRKQRTNSWSGHDRQREHIDGNNKDNYDEVVSVEFENFGEFWDLTVTAYGNYVAAGVIHHNSSKTTLGARMSVWAACEIPEAEVYNFHISDKRSIDDQQRFIYENLPDWLKNMPTKKGIAHSLQYTQKNGFTDGIAIMPPVKGYRRGGSIKFYNYAQFQQNDQIIEGIKANFVWADEKIPVDLFETLRMGRLGTYHGRMLITYTVVDGWNDVVERILSRTRTLKTRYCNHPKIMANLPIMQESLSVGSCCIHYAWTEDNPFADFKEFMKLYGNESREVILARAYGIPTKSVTSAFPLFSKEYVKDGGNVVKHEDLPWLKTRKNAKGQDVPYPVTFYMALDPAGSKAWFMVWVAIDAANTWWVYRESPENEEWALPGNKPGPATTPRIHGIKAYVEHITTAESGPDGDRNIYERIIDPRMGAAERQSQDGATTIISELDDAGLTFIPAPAASSEANKGEIEDGIQLINNLLAYKTDQPVDALNRPRLYVSDRCQNLIYALQEYTGKLGATEATKDPIDCLRYLRKANCEFVPFVKDNGSRTGVY